jgi:peptide-methionine (S)-S-oxide reductase
MKTVVIGAAVAVSLAIWLTRQEGNRQVMSEIHKTQIPADAKSLYVAGGCFWCIEAQFEDLKGVYEVESGYAGGTMKNPTYEDVCTGTTGHAEVVRIYYNPKEVSAEDLLHIFFTAHDPTTLNRQGPDVGTQYRSAIFYTTEEEKMLAEKVRSEVERERIWTNPIVTSIEPLKNYTKAEEYHQNYFEKYENATSAERARMNGGYCAAVIEPKVAKFRAKYRDKLKKK